MLHPPIAFAHRGASAHVPGNTLEAFELGLRLGATGLESDVWLTSDGVPVLDHDGIVRIGRRKRPIGQLRREELPEHIPALGDLLDRCGSDYHLSLDLKDVRAGAAVVTTIRHNAPAMLHRLWLCEQDVELLARLREVDPDIKLVNSTRLSRLRQGPERRAATLSARGIDAINLHHSDWNGGLVTLFHRFSRVCFGWDMQFDHVIRPALRMGIDGVFSDHVDRMVDAFVAELGAV